MKRITTIGGLRAALKENKGTVIGFVPTMGYLHEGHLSLLETARKENDVVVMSIFVNPTQFGPHEDFEAYPRDIERDEVLAKETGVDYIFYPSVEEMYPKGSSSFVEVEGDIGKVLCGQSRPIHFKGVTTVVNMLLNIIRPDHLYLGQKDAQQVAVLKKMVRDLHMDVDIRVCPIIREADGMAKSSRNIYLNEEERKQALALSRSLKKVKEAFEEGITEIEGLKSIIIEEIALQPLAIIEYVEIVDTRTLENIKYIKDEALVALAVHFGRTRLIDNIVLTKEER